MLARLAVIIGHLAAAHGHHDTARLDAIARDIWTAAGERPAYCGDDTTDAAQYATALSLAGIAMHESGYHPKVQNCTFGQKDPAASLFALLGPVAYDGATKREICADNAIAARKAAKVLARMRGAGDVLTQSQGYASGNTRVKSKAAREIADQIATLHMRERIYTRFHKGCLTAAYTE